MPFSVGDCPMVMVLRKRSLTSITRRQVMVSGSMSSRTNLQSSACVAAISASTAREAHLSKMGECLHEGAFLLSMHRAAPTGRNCVAHLERSSSVRLSGLLVSEMPNFFRRFSMTGAKLRWPPLPAGHSLLNSAASFCTQNPMSHPEPPQAWDAQLFQGASA